MSLPPKEIPLGAMRFNSDSQKLEYFNGDVWMQVHTFSPDLNGGARGLYAMGQTPSVTNVIGYITIPTAGDAADFGDLTQARQWGGVGASRTRAVWGGGSTPTKVDTIDYVTIASTGNAIDFGNKITSSNEAGGLSNQTRALFMGGYTSGGNPAGYRNEVEYITIASTGNAVDYGDLMSGKASQGQQGCSDSVRGFEVGGQYPAINQNTISYTNIASTGNFQDWGDISSGKNNSTAAMSNSTRCILAGGSKPRNISYFDFASKGNTNDFGDLQENRSYAGGTSNATRAVEMGGSTPSVEDFIEYVTIATTGDSVDFGNLTASYRGLKATSNAHGGLG